MKKVVKFGGSSLADSEQFKKVGDIIRSDPSRVYVIPSAPGKRFSGDEKVTDLLYKMYYKASKDEDFGSELDEIKSRYQEIIDGLGLEGFNLEGEFAQIERRMQQSPDSWTPRTSSSLTRTALWMRRRPTRSSPRSLKKRPAR